MRRLSEKIRELAYGLLPFVMLWVAATAASASPKDTASSSRRILALYDSAQFAWPKRTPVHRSAEAILNHLGCIVDYWDIAEGMPNEATMRGYRGIIAWFYTYKIADPDGYLSWSVAQIKAGRKIVVLGNLTNFVSSRTGRPASNALKEHYFSTLGISVDQSDYSDDPSEIELHAKQSAMVEFERTLDYELDYYLRIRPVDRNVRVYLSLQRKGVAGSESAMVLTGPAGGVVHAPYVLYQDPVTFREKWRLNPFLFFEEAFALQKRPVPDVTTLNGARLWCTHIDGDALISLSEIKPNTYCGEIIRDEIIAKYPWPITVSVVVSEVLEHPRFVPMARSIFEIDWVETASHSYSHPFFWDTRYEYKKKYKTRHREIPGYRFNERDEIVGSITYINRELAPKHKPVRVMLWTGNCEPTVAALNYCAEMNVLNMNGGDTILDGVENSYTTVAPLGVPVDGVRQYYAPESNENIYTNEWKGPYFAFRSVNDTFERTGTPIRIKPINIYYHFYIGEKWASLNSLKEVLDRTTAQEVAPVFVSEYLEMVKGFYSAQIEPLSEQGWRVRDLGACRTIRFDRTAAAPDLRRSSGVIGFLHEGPTLYVHLAGSQADIYLTTEPQRQVYLKKGSHVVENWQADTDRISFRSSGFGRGFFDVANLLPGASYEARIERPNKPQEKRILVVNRDGVLRLDLAMRGPVVAQIKRRQR